MSIHRFRPGSGYPHLRAPGRRGRRIVEPTIVTLQLATSGLVGSISYSVYLLHEPLLRLTGAGVRELGLAPTWALLLFVLVIGPLLIATSYGFFYVLERPFLRRGVQQKVSDLSPAETGLIRVDAAEASV